MDELSLSGVDTLLLHKLSLTGVDVLLLPELDLSGDVLWRPDQFSLLIDLLQSCPSRVSLPGRAVPLRPYLAAAANRWRQMASTNPDRL